MERNNWFLCSHVCVCFNYLKNRDSVETLSSDSLIIPQMPTIAGVSLGPKAEIVNQSRSSVWAVGTQVLEVSPAASRSAF